MKRIYICAPLGGDVERNLENVKQYARFALGCGTAPVVPHFYSLFLDDHNPKHRKLGMEAGLHLLEGCDEMWVFGDKTSPGMEAEILFCEERGIPILRFSVISSSAEALDEEECTCVENPCM